MIVNLSDALILEESLSQPSSNIMCSRDWRWPASLTGTGPGSQWSSINDELRQERLQQRGGTLCAVVTWLAVGDSVTDTEVVGQHPLSSPGIAPWFFHKQLREFCRQTDGDAQALEQFETCIVGRGRSHR